MLRAKEHTSTPFPSIVFTFGLVVESIKELRGASIVHELANKQNLKIKSLRKNKKPTKQKDIEREK
jgi:hypothetical protein